VILFTHSHELALPPFFSFSNLLQTKFKSHIQKPYVINNIQWAMQCKKIKKNIVEAYVERNLKIGCVRPYCPASTLSMSHTAFKPRFGGTEATDKTISLYAACQSLPLACLYAACKSRKFLPQW
jgi:hypothetical protein